MSSCFFENVIVLVCNLGLFENYAKIFNIYGGLFRYVVEKQYLYMIFEES